MKIFIPLPMENLSTKTTRYKIVLVPFPFDDFSSLKVRPALCITNVIGKYEHVIIAFISSKLPHDLMETDIILEKHSENFRNTGLQVDSVIRTHKMVTIPKSLIKRELGTINTHVQQQLKRCIENLFG